MRPGISACFECAPPCIVAERGDESKITRAVVCAASLPTTVSIVAGMLVQTALKLLLGFGTLNTCVGYDGLGDYMPAYEMKASRDCSNENCRSLQLKLGESGSQVFSSARAKVDSTDSLAENLHGENEWGISVEDSGLSSH
jgi:ubiquitin-like modifier-activating enzyme 5